ncbi:MAG: helix-turn-helix domain-containing protein [Defluviitaleaceae bacterium]|nr:helix-turn-helix domain-containing protein [Defluviitaleaceae bacterium]
MFGTNLKKARASRELSQAALARMLSVSQQTIASWEVNRTTPPPEMIAKISKVLCVSTGFLLGTPFDTPQVLRIPVLGHIPAGIPIEAIEDVLDYEEAPLSWGTGGREYFALKIKGDSMSPEYMNGDVVIFLAANDCESGDDCAVIINGDDATFKKVIKHMDGIMLQPINTGGYAPAFYSNAEISNLPVRVIGIAEEIRRKLKKA